MRYFFLILSISLLFSGCSSKKQVVAVKKELPSWFLTIQANNDSYIYGTGEGKTKEEAIANALSFMVSTLSVSIASDFQANTVVKEGYNSSNKSTYTSNIQSDVKKIRISNYELIESEELGFKKHIVMLRSDKKALFESLRSEIEQNFLLIEQKKNALSSANAIQRAAFYRQTQDSLSTLPNTLLVMNTLDKEFTGDSYLAQVQTIMHEYEALMQSITFSLKSNSDATKLLPSIAKGLSDKKLILDERYDANHFRVLVTSTTEKATSYGFTLARSAIEINIEDANGAIIGSNKLNITGQSTQGYELAQENAAMKLADIIQKEGIEKVIGLRL